MTDIKLKIKLKDILPTKEDLIKLKFLQSNEDLVELDESGSDELLKEFTENCFELGFDPDDVQNVVLIIEALKYAKEGWEVE